MFSYLSPFKQLFFKNTKQKENNYYYDTEKI